MIGEVAHMAVGARILEDRAKNLFRVHHLGLTDDDLNAQRLGPGLHHGDVLRVAIAVDKEALGLGFRAAQRHGHRLGTGGSLIQKRRIGDFQPGKVAHHGLEIEQRFQTALRNLGLVGRIGRVPRRVLKNIPLDRRRRDSAVIALSDQAGEHLVLARNLAHVLKHLALAHRLAEIKWLFRTDRLGQRVIDQRIKAFGAHGVEHLRHFGRGRANVTPVGEIIRQIIGGLKAHVGFLVTARQRRPLFMARRPKRATQVISSAPVPRHAQRFSR